MSKLIGKKKIFYLMAVLGLLIFLYFAGPLKRVEGVVIRLLSPVFSRAYFTGSIIRVKYDEQTNKIDLTKKVDELEGQIVELTKENIGLKKMEEENMVLRGYLDFLTINQYKYVMSNVVARGEAANISDRTEVITIDKGSRDGVFLGLAVVSSDGVIIGKVSDVKENSAQVFLTNNEKCKLAASVFNTDKTSGITEGDMGLTVRMEFIPQDQKIEKNDVIVTSGLEQFVPRGLIIGKVMEVDRESNELWQKAVIEPMVDLNNLIVVSVLLP